MIDEHFKELWFKMTTEQIQELIDKLPPEHKETLSDSYHSFKELYEFRKMYNAALFNEWASKHMNVLDGIRRGLDYSHCPPPKYQVHKSWKHHDGEACFGGEWFIVCAMLPDGQISNHYKAEDWELFRVPEEPKSLWKFDGHTGKDVLERLKALNK